MIQLSRWKVYVVAAALLLATLFAFPNLLTPAQREALPGFVPSGVLNLGLDLQGGSYLMLQVDVDEVRETRVNSLVEDMRVILTGQRIAFSNLERQPGGFTVTITDPANYDRALSELQQLARPTSTGVSDVAVTRQTNNRIRAAFTDQALSNMGAKAVDQSIEVIRRRIDSLGTREPSITRQGTNRIVVQAPGESDPEALERVIGQTAKLTFQMVDDDNSARGSHRRPRAARRRADAGRVRHTPADQAPHPGVRRDPDPRQRGLRPAGRPAIDFRFDGQGARRFGEATSQNVGKRFAIILDGKVISAPNINSPITGGSGQITGSFSTPRAPRTGEPAATAAPCRRR